MIPNTSATNHCGPNFWLWNGNQDLVTGDGTTNIPWSEIDIFEIGGNTNTLTNNIHYVHYPQPDSTNHNQGYTYPTAISGNTWHTAGCWWTSNGITFYLDGVAISGLSNPLIKPDSLLPMPIFVDINSPATNFCDSFNVSDTYHYTYQVDYVKVWQIKDSCSTNATICNNYSSYNSKLYNTVTVDGGSCVDAITGATYYTIYGATSVTLEQGFSIDNTSNVLISTQDCNTSTIKTIQFNPKPPPQSWILRNNPN